MTFANIVGALLVASPFVGIAVYVVLTGGWIPMLAIFGAVALIAAVFWVGVGLLLK